MAERLGVASSTISEDVKVIRERWRDRATADYGSHLAEELAKLDLLEHELLPTALSGGPKGGVNLRAVDRVLAIRDRRARMLGLDSPSRLEVTMRVEQVAKAIELVVVEMGLDPDTVRPILGAKLRELRHLRELAPGSCSAKSRPLRPAVSLVRRPGREGKSRPAFRRAPRGYRGRPSCREARSDLVLRGARVHRRVRGTCSGRGAHRCADRHSGHSTGCDVRHACYER